jgi:hypothetical protein
MERISATTAFLMLGFRDLDNQALLTRLDMIDVLPEFYLDAHGNVFMFEDNAFWGENCIGDFFRNRLGDYRDSYLSVLNSLQL